MNIQKITNSQNFEGKLVILNDLSCKPYANINKVKTNIQKQIETKKYNLYIGQDYSANKIRIAVSYYEPRYIQGVLTHEELPITAKSSRYIYATKNAIDKYEKALADIENKNSEQKQREQKKQELKDNVVTIFFAPLYITGSILEDISPKLAEKYVKLLYRLGF